MTQLKINKKFTVKNSIHGNLKYLRNLSPDR